MSLILTRLARLAMATAPLHAFDAPTAGSGKSMIVDIAAILATGETAPVFAQGPNLEEFEKRLSVQLMAGRQIIAIDNINNELDGDLLNQSLTQDKVDLRILGQSREVTVQCSTVTTATGNNLKLVGDLTRRAVIGRLDPKTDRPEIRQFDYDPLDGRAREPGRTGRGGAHHPEGLSRRRACPSRPPRLQGFAEWSDLVRGALMWIGLGDPAATQERLRENDPKLTTLIRVATVWRKAFGSYRDDRSRGGGEGGGEEEGRHVVGVQIGAGQPRPSRRLHGGRPPRRGDQPGGAGQISQLRGRPGRRLGDGRQGPVPKGGNEAGRRPLDLGRGRRGSGRGRGPLLTIVQLEIYFRGVGGVGGVVSSLYLELHWQFPCGA